MICVRVHDHREKPGYVACTIAVSSFLLIQCNLTVYFTSGIWDWAAWNYWSKLFDTHLCYYSLNENILSVLNTVRFLLRVYICIMLNINGIDMVAQHLYITIYISANFWLHCSLTVSFDLNSFIFLEFQADFAPNDDVSYTGRNCCSCHHPGGY